MEPILNIENLTKTYGAVPNQTKALNGITFQVMPGEFLGIMGSSGSGKTTLLNCIAAVVKPAGGSIVMEDRNLRSLDGRALAEYRGKTVGYLFQNFELLDNLTGRENILLPASLHKVTEKAGSLRLKQLAEYLEITDAERPITTLPMNYTYGLSVINSHLLKGATTLLTNKGLMQKEFWDFFKEQQATSIAGVPYTYEMLKRLRFFRMELPSLKTLTQAGGKLSPELHREFAEYAIENGKRFVVMYGQTEATARMSYLPWQKTLEKCGSMGIAIPGGRFDLIDEDGNIITSPEVTGELVYTGQNVTPGYAECGDDLIKGDERHGVLVTGDLAKRDADGYFYIVGRKKRFLKIFGNRVNLDETERLIKAAFPDTECACIGKDDKMTICITSQEKHTEIRNYLSQKTGLNHVAFQVKTVQQIPKNDAGKTLYAKLEEEL